jgi:glycosyltransferase involved in cell wall biosynthesis
VPVDAPEPVFAVIPVFNRLHHTLHCVERLKAQSYPTRVVVADGGSTDGTPAKLRELHPDITVLAPGRELFWGGASKLGIDHALRQVDGDHAYILMVNNDTTFDNDLVAKLVETSRALGGAGVGAVVVDADDPGIVIDGGICLDWKAYRYSTVKAIPDPPLPKTDVDMLPGRAGLVPFAAIRKAGSVDAGRFPHYLADYEFTHRLKRRAGLMLAVDYRARVATRVAPARPAPQRKAWRELAGVLFGRRSKSNVLDHYNFIRLHAPPDYRNQLLRRLVKAQIRTLTGGLGVRFPRLRGLKRRLPLPVRAASRRLARGLRFARPERVMRLLTKPYYVDEADCRGCGLTSQTLLEAGILAPLDRYGLFRFALPRHEVTRLMPQAEALLDKSLRPSHKVRTFLRIRRQAAGAGPAAPDVAPPAPESAGGARVDAEPAARRPAARLPDSVTEAGRDG